MLDEPARKTVQYSEPKEPEIQAPETVVDGLRRSEVTDGVRRSETTDRSVPWVKPKQPQKARLVVVCTVSHVRFTSSQQSHPVDVRFARMLDVDEQPWSRELWATTEWKSLECGWIEDCGMLVLRNDGPEVVELGVEVSQLPKEKRTMLDPPRIPPVAFAKVPPGEGMPFNPVDVKRLVVRSVKGTCKVRVDMFAE